MLHASLSLLGALAALMAAWLWASTIMVWVLMLVAMILVMDAVTLLWSRGGGMGGHRQ